MPLIFATGKTMMLIFNVNLIEQTEWTWKDFCLENFCPYAQMWSLGFLPGKYPLSHLF